MRNLISLQKAILFFSLLFVYFISTAQTIEISGKITDNSNSEALSFVNIQINGSRYGTISNNDGYFKLNIPDKYIGYELVFSSIGYENRVEKITKERGLYNIALKPVDAKIAEIIIMPDSTLLTFLEKVYKKIPENYPTKPTILKGFYRETKKTDKNQYLYLAEAVIESFKTDYRKKRNKGQIKIIKSVANEFPGRDSINNLKFYGGAFFPNTVDFVYQKRGFINPKSFYAFNYSMTSTTVYNNRNVYIVDFDNKNDSLAGYAKGKIYIDKASLAYIAFEIELTDKGLNSLNENNARHNYKRFQRKYKVFYNESDGKWNLKYMSIESKAKNGSFSGEIIENYEFIATEVQTENVKPFTVSEQMQYGDVFLEKAVEYYSENYWSEYNILEKDTFLKSYITPLYTKDESKELLTLKVQPPKEPFIKKFIKNSNISYNITKISEQNLCLKSIVYSMILS